MDIIKNPNGHLAHLNGNRGPRLAPTLAQAEMHARAQAAQRRNTTAVSPMAVHIDVERLERAGKLVPLSRRSAMSEALRRIKLPLLAHAKARRSSALNQRGALIMVTSALPGEGKTFFATNLAMSMAAEIDHSVLLVEADVIRPTLLQQLGVRAGFGLLDVLSRDGLDVNDVVLPTNVPKLSLLPVGTPHPHSTEMLASGAMESVLLSLMASDPNRIVIFDVPPLLVASGAQALASRVGQVVMVVEAQRTPSPEVARAFAMLDDRPLVMSVLNKIPESALAHSHASYYG